MQYDSCDTRCSVTIVFVAVVIHYVWSSWQHSSNEAAVCFDPNECWETSTANNTLNIL